MVTRLTVAVTPGHELVTWSLLTPKAHVVDEAAEPDTRPSDRSLGDGRS